MRSINRCSAIDCAQMARTACPNRLSKTEDPCLVFDNGDQMQCSCRCRACIVAAGARLRSCAASVDLRRLPGVIGAQHFVDIARIFPRPANTAIAPPDRPGGPARCDVWHRSRAYNQSFKAMKLCERRVAQNQAAACARSAPEFATRSCSTGAKRTSLCMSAKSMRSVASIVYGGCGSNTSP